jgi:hypothetical protein
MADILITAELLNSLYKQHIDKTFEEGHPWVVEKLNTHNDDTQAHNIPARVKAIVQAHKQNLNAHQKEIEALKTALISHTHFGIVEEVTKKLEEPLRVHLIYGHPDLQARLNRVWVVALQGPAPEDTVAVLDTDNTLTFCSGNKYPVYGEGRVEDVF